MIDDISQRILHETREGYWRETALRLRDKVDELGGKRYGLACFAACGWGAFIWMLIYEAAHRWLR